jgi:hypothetical protein
MTTPTPQQIVDGTNVAARMNENFLSMLVAIMYGRKPTTTGLTWAYYGAVFAETIVPDGTVALTDNATNYIVAARATGAVTAATATTNWDDSTDYVRLHKVTTLSGAITAWEDHRLDTGGLFGGGGGGALGANLTSIQGLSGDADTMVRFTGGGAADEVVLDPDPDLGASAASDDVIPTQAAVQAYVDAHSGGGGASSDLEGIAWLDVNGNDGTGTVGDITKPFLTANAALDALASFSPAVLMVGLGEFAPITDDYQGSTTPDPASKLRSDLTIRGAQMPVLDSVTAPTKLEKGSIIKGPLIFNTQTRANIKMFDVGIDSGSAVCTALYAGAAQEGLLFANIPVSSPTPQRGYVIDRVIALCKDAVSAVHGILLEGLIKPQVGMIQSYFGTHGVAIKCDGGTFGSIHSFGHTDDTVIIKYGTNAVCREVAIGRILGGEIGAGDTDHGVVFHGDDGVVQNIAIGEVVLKGIASAEIRTLGGTHQTKNVRINALFGDGPLRTSLAATSVEKHSFIVNGEALDDEYALTDGATINTDLSLAHNFRVTLGGNRTLANPTNPRSGQVYNWRIKQDGTGSRTLAYGNKFKFPGGAPVLSTAINTLDFLSAQYSATDDQYVAVLIKAMA